MSSQQRNYRPPASTATYLNDRDRSNDANITTQEMLENQWSNSLQTNHLQQASSAGPTLAERLERFNIASPTAQELSEFQRALDHQCLLQSLDPDAEPTVSSGTLVQITLYLSGPLLQGSDSQSGRFRDVQLRALVAAFALLHHNGLRSLMAESHDQLRLNIADRFREIVDSNEQVASQTGLEDRIRKADALYSIRLAAQYFSLIERDQPLPDAIAIPIIGLVLAGASIASGQYVGLRSIFHYADHIIGLIPGRTSQHLSLPGIQELTRNATTLLDSVIEEDHQDEDVSDVIRTANDTVELVQRLLRVHIQDIPSKRNDSWNWPLARLRRNPPLLNKWYFFYGLLDCVAQLARRLGPGQLHMELLVMMKQLMEESDFEEFRWKIIEIFQAYEPTRADIHQWLKPAHDRSDIDESRALMELAAVRTISRQRFLAALEDDTGPSARSARFGFPSNRHRLAYRALIDAQRRSNVSVPPGRRAIVQPARGETIEPHPRIHGSVSTRSTNGPELSLPSEEPQPPDTPSTSEDDFEDYVEGDLRYCPQNGVVH
ncbi:MAG: hypothetical protein Q9224_006215, partial [Gallowayella concinna]